MPVDAFDNHLKIPFVEERLSPPPQKHAWVPILCLLCRRPTSPSSSAQARPPRRSPKRKRAKATGKLLVLALMAKRKTHGACLAPRTEATDAYAPVSFFMRAAFPGRQPSIRNVRLTGRHSRKEESASLPSISVQGVLHRLPPVLAESIPHKRFSCQTAQDFFFKK